MKVFSPTNPFLLILILLLAGCSDDPVSEDLTPSELLLGTWKVSSAVIDGQTQPVTNPGLGQISASFEKESYSYIFPETTDTGLPTGNTVTTSGTWSFNNDHTLLTLTPVTGSQLPTLVWEIVSLSPGILNTSFEQPNPANGGQVSTFEINYSLNN